MLRDLYEAGCRNVQFDDCTWGMLVDEGYRKSREGSGVTLEEEAERYLRVNNLALEGRPEDLAVNTHICRGNYHSTYACSGPYDRVADYVFARENVDALYLEYDDARSGSFAPLSKVPKGRKVVLGLVTTKRPELEDEDAVIARIREAEQYIPLERLCLSPQCGFASCEIGNKLTEEEQWDKLALVKPQSASGEGKQTDFSFSLPHTIRCRSGNQAIPGRQLFGGTGAFAGLETGGLLCQQPRSQSLPLSFD